MGGEETVKNYKGLHYGTEAAHLTQIKSELSGVLSEIVV
jgi:hypothetical protein